MGLSVPVYIQEEGQVPRYTRNLALPIHIFVSAKITRNVKTWKHLLLISTLHCSVYMLGFVINV